MTLDDTIHTVTLSMRAANATDAQIAAVVRDLKKTAEQEKALRSSAAGKRTKSQFVVLRTRAEKGSDANADSLGWVLQLEESCSPAVAYQRVLAAADAFNGSKKGRLLPVKTLGEALENVPAKWYKTSNPTEVTKVKTRVPVAVLTIPSNELPSVAADKGRKEAA